MPATGDLFASGDANFLPSLIHPFPANAAQVSTGSSTKTAKSRRTRIVLNGEYRARPERIRSGPHSILKHVRRATIILQLGDGLTLSRTMQATGMPKPTVRCWWGRFLVEGVDGLLYVIPGETGRKPVSQEKAREAIELAMRPSAHCSHWTQRALAKWLGIGVPTVFGILRRSGLKLHRVKTFRVCRDPRFDLKVLDVVGRHVDPPDHAVVISEDEKPQMQAPGRTKQPLPMKPCHPVTRAHDCKRNGTTGLMAALDVATGRVTGQLVERRRSENFLAFLDQVPGGIRAGTPVHVILDNVPSHKSAEVDQLLRSNPDWTFHFTPSSSSWMNAVKGFFSKLWRQRLKHATFNSLDECIAAIKGCIEHHNANGTCPFRWGRKPEDLVEAWQMGHQKLQELAS